MIDNRLMDEREREMQVVARDILDYLGERGSFVDAYTMLADVARRCHVSEAEVGTALSRVADRLVWDYSRGPVHFCLVG